MTAILKALSTGNIAMNFLQLCKEWQEIYTSKSK